jgi:glucose/arabinose dehydrogenase
MKTFRLFFGLIGVVGLAVPMAAASCSDETEDGSSGSGTPTTTTSNGGSGGSGVGGGSGGIGGDPDPFPLNGSDCSDPSGTAGQLQITEVVNGLSSPVLATHAWGDSERLYIVEQRGRIQLWRNNTLTEFLDIESLVDFGGERGLLGLAFHPDYVNNGRFFVHYSDTGGDTAIQEFQRSAGDPDAADPNPVGMPFIQISQPYGNHNGGSIEFSPFDGFLYIGLGDGGSGGDPDGNGQDDTTELGALLRIDVDPMPYTVPPGNLAAPSADTIYDWGLRNPYRFAFDPCNGDRYIGDVGQNQLEEIDIAGPMDGNINWGWNTMEGTQCFNSNNCDMSGLRLPATEYDHNTGCSVTGGFVYRGTAIPWLRGAYLYGDYCGGQVWMLRWDGSQATDESQVLDTGFNISGFGQDNDGEVYVIDYNGGSLHRVTSM